LKWKLNDLAGCEVERAVLSLKLAGEISGGRLGVYPLVKKGIGTAGVLEYMPRWEERTTYGLRPGEDLVIEITGILSEWTSGDLANRGLVLAYEGFPGEDREVALEGIPNLTVDFQNTRSL
jgi:hypothetical protein